MSYGYIYKTTNIINGRIYIGKKRGTFTQFYLGSGKILERAVKEYGRNNFRLEVLAFATTKEMLNGLEKKYIYEYRQVFGNRFLYNITDGGDGRTGAVSEDHKKKISLSKLGKKFSEEGKKNMSLAHLGKPKSEEHKRKLRERLHKIHLFNLGKPLSEEHKNNISISHLGIGHSEESKKKISKAIIEMYNNGAKNPMLGKHHSEETRLKISVSNKIRNQIKKGILT